MERPQLQSQMEAFDLWRSNQKQVVIQFGNSTSYGYFTKETGCVSFARPQKNPANANNVCKQAEYQPASLSNSFGHRIPIGNGCVKPFTELLDERRIKLAGHILRSPNSDPLRQVTYQPDSAEPVEIGKRRIGRPRQQWTFRSNELIHSKLSHTDYRGFDVQNHNILTAARQRRV